MPELHFLNSLDYAVLGVYMLIILGIGFYVARFNRSTVDYFKGGGNIPWKLSCVSLFISGFSAFMFVGAAGITYVNGGGALVLFSLAFFAYLLGFFIYGPLWRRTRLNTPLEFLTRRFSQGTTYCYTLLAVIPNVLVLGIMIYTLCIFTSTAFGMNRFSLDFAGLTIGGFELTLLLTGLVIIIYTTLGGLWAVMVTDGMQFLIVFLVTLLMTPLAFALLGDGSPLDGIGRLLREAPEGYFEVKLEGKPLLFWPTWMVYIILGYNVNWHIAQRYYSVADERDTRKMALWCSGLSLVLPLMWILPVLTTPILFPDLASLWPQLEQPSEASFVTLALAVLPHGMLGLLTAAIFAATMSSTDTLFNWLGAVLTKDVYVPLRKTITGSEPSESAQLWAGRCFVALLGLAAIWVAFSVQRFGGAFDVYVRAESLYKTALFVPVFIGLLYTKTPWWSAIASVGCGVLGVLAVGVFAASANGQSLGLMNIFFSDFRFTWLGFEVTRFEVNTLVGVFVSGSVFLLSAFFNKREGAFRQRVESLENDLRTPAHADSDAHMGVEGIKAYRILGWMAIVIGGFMILLAIPTFGEGAWLNVFVGLISVGIGWVILTAVRRYENRFSFIPPEPPTPEP